jgi:hypothetical protein
MLYLMMCYTSYCLQVLLRAATVMSHLCTLRNAPVQKLAKTATKYIDAFTAIQTQQHKVRYYYCKY